MLKFKREGLEQAFRSLKITCDHSLPGARSLRIFVGDNDDGAFSQDSDYIKSVNDYFIKSLECDTRETGLPFKDWLREIDYMNVTHGYQRPWHSYS